MRRRGWRSALGRQRGIPHPLLQRRGQRSHIFIDILSYRDEILIKILRKTCFFLSEVSAAKKTKKGNHQGMLKVIQHALTIANFLSDHPARLGITIKMASIGEGDYHVVKKEPCVVHGLSVFMFFWELQKITPPARKKNGRKLWAGPPTCSGVGEWANEWRINPSTLTMTSSILKQATLVVWARMGGITKNTLLPTNNQMIWLGCSCLIDCICVNGIIARCACTFDGKTEDSRLPPQE